MVRPRSWIVLGVLLVAGAWAVRAVAGRLARTGVAVELDEVVGLESAPRSLLGRAGAALKATGSAALGGSVSFRVRARNTTPVPVWVRSARFRAWSGDRELGRGTWTAPSGAVLFRPGQDVPILVTLDGDGAAMRAAGLRFVQGKDVQASGDGEVEAGLPLLFLSLPFEVSRVGMPRDRRGGS
jgi:hypothetical protein